jgi:hypothetical protein
MKIIITLVVLISLAAAGQTPPPMHFSDPQVQSNYETALARVARPIPPPRVLVPGSPWPTNVSFGPPSRMPEFTQEGLSAYITPVTNLVSTLRDLEFSVVITNIAPTNVTIHPWILINGLGTVTVYDARGAIMAQQPPVHPFMTMPPTRAEIAAEPPSNLVLKPGESYSLKYKLGDYMIATPPGKYLAREAFIPSNDVEITIE